MSRADKHFKTIYCLKSVDVTKKRKRETIKASAKRKWLQKRQVTKTTYHLLTVAVSRQVAVFSRGNRKRARNCPRGVTRKMTSFSVPFSLGKIASFSL